MNAHFLHIHDFADSNFVADDSKDAHRNLVEFENLDVGVGSVVHLEVLPDCVVDVDIVVQNAYSVEVPYWQCHNVIEERHVKEHHQNFVHEGAHLLSNAARLVIQGEPVLNTKCLQKKKRNIDLNSVISMEST